MQRMVAWFTENKRSLQTILAAVSMVLILVYTFWHTAALLASFVTPAPVGWIAALGIEAAVVALSLRAGAYKKTLAAALIVSAIANIERGARESGLAADGLTFASIGNIDWIQAVIGVAATALLSVLVFRLADIVSHDAQGGKHDSNAAASSPGAVAGGTNMAGPARRADASAGATDAQATLHPAVGASASGSALSSDNAAAVSEWRIVAPVMQPEPEVVQVATNGNGHHATDVSAGVCKRCGQAMRGNAGSHWTWDCPANPDKRKRKGA
jgi:hypothetical protein